MLLQSQSRYRLHLPYSTRLCTIQVVVVVVVVVVMMVPVAMVVVVAVVVVVVVVDLTLESVALLPLV